MPRLVYLLGWSLVLLGGGLAFTDLALGRRPGVTEANVRRLRLGMTLAEVEAILGSPDKLASGGRDYWWAIPGAGDRAPGGRAMPVHDWSRVDAGIFHAFHHDWITELARALNRGLLPADYCALPGQFAAGFGPGVLTLQGAADEGTDGGGESPARTADGQTAVRLVAPPMQPVAETDMAFYRRKQKAVTIRHVSGDRIVAMIEIASPGNKAARNPLRAFVRKAAELLENGIHLLIIDLHPPGKRDPEGLHSEIWQEIAGEEYALPPGKPLTLAAYENGNAVKAYVLPVAVGEALPDMPLFLEPGQAVMIPLEATYNAAFVDVPRRWRRVLETPSP